MDHHEGEREGLGVIEHPLQQGEARTEEAVEGANVVKPEPVHLGPEAVPFVLPSTSLERSNVVDGPIDPSSSGPSSSPALTARELAGRSGRRTKHGPGGSGTSTSARSVAFGSSLWPGWLRPPRSRGDTEEIKLSKSGKRRSKKTSSSRAGERRSQDSDVMVEINRDEARRSSFQAPPEPPPPTATTADALNRAAEGRKTRAKGEPKLHFAPEQKRFRKKDLPPNFEVGDYYRGLDDYVRQTRRARRVSRKLRSSSSARSAGGSSKASSADSSSSSSDGDSSSSSSSSSSSASGRLTMARLRAFFGDSSSGSSTSSSSDDSESDGDSSGSSSSSSSSTGNFRMFSRSRTGGSALRRRSSRFSEDEPAQLPFRSPSIASHADQEGSHKPRTPALPRTPAPFGGAFQLKGGAKRKRQRRARQRMKAQEKELIRQGRLPPRPSKKARRKAKLARAQAGGVTEFTLFTPVSLPDVVGKPSRPAMNSRGMTAQRVEVRNSSDKGHHKMIADNGKVLQTSSFLAVKDRLHALRRYRRQVEGAEGDIGLSERHRKLGHDASDINGKDGEADEEADEGADLDASDDYGIDLEDGDLALPPPALDLPPVAETKARSSSQIKSASKSDDDEARTGWHMSDVPLTPHLRMATDFARGFIINPISGRAGQMTSSTAPHLDIGAIAEGEDEAKHSSTSGTRVESGQGGPSPSGAAVDHGHAAWWLDVNCPTYRDMAELSKMFPLHPLTVEDVLQQDTREKVEVFESLGYYFVVVRAIDESYFRYTSSEQGSNPAVFEATNARVGQSGPQMEMDDLGDPDGERKLPFKSGRRPRVEIVEGVGGKEGLEGVSVGAKNLYLIVFSHGVISFHFEDVSKHTDRVRSRLVDLTQPVELTSDWIAHGLFDSIVDAFFPLLAFLEAEVEELEQMTSEPLPLTKREVLARRMVAVSCQPLDKDNNLPMTYGHINATRIVLRALPSLSIPKKLATTLPSSWVVERFHVRRLDLDELPQEPRSVIQRLFRLNRRRARVRAFLSGSAQGQSEMLRRITDVRKIVTGLSRLLAPKNDSVRGLRKRLVELRTGAPGLSRIEMSIYMGDVHDHIVTLMTHLSNGDARLSDIHISYLSSIRINNRRVKQSTDEILVVLASVTVTLLACVCFSAIWGMNVTVPKNLKMTNAYHWFGGVVAVVVSIPVLIIIRVRLWIKQAKQRSDARRAIR